MFLSTTWTTLHLSLVSYVSPVYCSTFSHPNITKFNDATLYPAVLLYKKLSIQNFWTRSTMKMKLGLVQINYRVLNVQGCACFLPHTQSLGHLLNVGGCACSLPHTQSLGHLLNVRRCACSFPNNTQSLVGDVPSPLSHSIPRSFSSAPPSSHIPLPISACDLLHIAFSLHISHNFNYFIINC